MTRPDSPLAAPEEETLVGFLTYQRATLAWKCSDVSDDDLRRSIHPTDMTLGGLLKHLARVEDYWFAEAVGRQPRLAPWDGMPWAAEWSDHVGHTGDELRTMWQASVDRSTALVRERLASAGLDELFPAWGGEGEVSLRWVLVHMIEEYARHNGHADLLRQAIDGATGE